MRVGFAGETHLAQTNAKAAEIRGFDVVMVDGYCEPLSACDLVFIARDADTAEDLEEVERLTRRVISATWTETPIVVLSQVLPGFTRKHLERHSLLFYQVDTIIMNCALERVLHPERHIIGCEHPDKPLPPALADYLEWFPAPVVKMGLESAELAKLAINFILASQVAAANTLKVAAASCRASWSDIIPALRLDARIGKSYLEPGYIGGHLPRDVRRVRNLAPTPFAEAIGPLA